MTYVSQLLFAVSSDAFLERLGSVSVFDMIACLLKHACKNYTKTGCEYVYPLHQIV